MAPEWYMRLRVKIHLLVTVVTARVTFRLRSIRADRFGDVQISSCMKYGNGNNLTRSVPLLTSPRIDSFIFDHVIPSHSPCPYLNCRY